MRFFRLSLFVLLVYGLSPQGNGKDYILTIGGGYEPSGNQASLEANVLFFQQTVRERHPSPSEHFIYFADGFDNKADLQILTAKPNVDSPALEFLKNVFDSGQDRYEYRDHQVKDIQGALNPTMVRSGFGETVNQLVAGDRLIIYVTAHGGSAKGSDPYNTSIMCWNKRTLSMKSFSEWLDEVPSTVPVVMIMAQCYCGGFANTMFLSGDSRKGVAPGLRVGFFAQRHDLPAAGCRPDIENDEEYSSYFWGAFMGRSRTGKPVGQVDCNGDGRISFAEAHAHAVVASQTIDIPLKSSEAFLRQCSRIGDYDDPEAALTNEINLEQSDVKDDSLYKLSGTIAEIAALASPDQRRMVVELSKQLDVPLNSEVTEVFVLSEAQRKIFSQSRRGPARRGRFSRRRDLRNEIIEKWPELAETKDWSSLEALRPERSEAFLEQVRSLPSYESFQQSQVERTRTSEQSTKAELKDVQYRRLIHSLETVLYEQNLPYVASPEKIEKYRAMIAIEATSFDR